MIDISPETIGALGALILALVKIYYDSQGKKTQVQTIEYLETELEKSTWALSSLLKARDQYRVVRADGLTIQEKAQCFDEIIPFMDFIDKTPFIDTTRSA